MGWTPLAVPLWSAQKPSAISRLRIDSLYESSAFVGAALDTATLPYRLAASLRPSQFLASMVPAHRPTCGLLQALPLPCPRVSAPFIGQTQPGLAQSFFDLTATKPLSSNPYTSLVLRGSEPRRLLQLCEELPPLARRFCFAHARALPLPVPFPQVFSEGVSSQGLLCQGSARARAPDCEVEQCPTATQLHAAAQAGRCEALRIMARTVKSRQ